MARTFQNLPCEFVIEPPYYHFKRGHVCVAELLVVELWQYISVF